LEAALLGLGAGLASGFFGIGGGIVMVPAMAIFLSLDIVQAVATSLFVMGPSALIGSLQHFLQGHVHLELALPLILGIALGAQLGPLISTRMPKARLRQLFGLVLLYSAVNMILNGL
ncbi:MAG: sulfite exporter TauE/SafE family protein, partial [Candidatus Bipolaricaulia bacterium]